MEDKPLILVTNDDGIDSMGLWAVVEAVLPLGDILVAAPDREWSGGGRSMPPDLTGDIKAVEPKVDSKRVEAYALDASPALAVVCAMLKLARRRPALVVSGVNRGLNVGVEVTISGTVGAALEAAAFQIPALAVSLDIPQTQDVTGDGGIDYTAARAFTRRFARQLCGGSVLPADVGVLNINVPYEATPETPWRLARLSRQRYWVPRDPGRHGEDGYFAYSCVRKVKASELGSDVRTIRVDGMVSVTPLSLDLTSRVAFAEYGEGYDHQHVARITELLDIAYDGDLDPALVPLVAGAGE
ncbi:MAG: 5'/3'-nucleotidase SurE [Anaerolineales bacterium]